MSRFNKKNRNINNNTLFLEEKRRIELYTELEKNKLPKRDHGEQYTYIKYGKPVLEDIIQNEKKRQDDILDLQIMISKRLKEMDISLKGNIDVYNKYIDQGKFNVNNLNSIIKEIEINDFFIKDKRYINYSKIHGTETARSLILNDHIQNKKMIKKINNKMVIYFD